MVREGRSSGAGAVGEFLKGERGLVWAWTLEREKNPGKPSCAGVATLVPGGEGRFWREMGRAGPEGPAEDCLLSGHLGSVSPPLLLDVVTLGTSPHL